MCVCVCWQYVFVFSAALHPKSLTGWVLLGTRQCAARCAHTLSRTLERGIYFSSISVYRLEFSLGGRDLGKSMRAADETWAERVTFWQQRCVFSSGPERQWPRPDHHWDRGGPTVLLCWRLPPAVPAQGPWRLLRTERNRSLLSTHTEKLRNLWTKFKCFLVGFSYEQLNSFTGNKVDETDLFFSSLINISVCKTFDLNSKRKCQNVACIRNAKF